MAPKTNDQNPSPLSLDQCTLTAEGIGSVVYYLRAHPLFAGQHETRLRAMAITFLAFGGTDDGDHTVPPGNLHPAHFAVHKFGQPDWPGDIREGYIQTVMDLLTWLDRLSGGATFMIHCPGTRPPNTGPMLKKAEFDVFLPITLLREHPTLAPVVEHLVHCFARRVGAIAMDRWGRAKRLHVGGMHDNSASSSTLSRGWVYQAIDPYSSTPTLVIDDRFPGQLETYLAAMSLSTSSLPPTSPTPISRLNDPSSSNSSETRSMYRLGQPYIKFPYSDDGSGTDEVVERIDRGIRHDTGDSDPALIEALRWHIDDLEKAIRARDVEIVRLRDMLHNEGRDTEHESLSSGSSPAINRAIVTPSDTPGSKKGKVAAHRALAAVSSSLSSLSSVSSFSSDGRSGGRTPTVPNSGTACAQSTSATLPHPNSSRPTVRIKPNFSTPRLWGRSRTSQSLPSPTPPGPSAPAVNTSRPSPLSVSTLGLGQETPSTSTSPSTPHSSCTMYSPGYFGDHTNRVIKSYNLPQSTHAIIYSVESNYAVVDWLQGVASNIPCCSPEMADKFVKAMREDCDMSP